MRINDEGDTECHQVSEGEKGARAGDTEVTLRMNRQYFVWHWYMLVPF